MASRKTHILGRTCIGAVVDDIQQVAETTEWVSARRSSQYLAQSAQGWFSSPSIFSSDALGTSNFRPIWQEGIDPLRIADRTATSPCCRRLQTSFTFMSGLGEFRDSTMPI